MTKKIIYFLFGLGLVFILLYFLQPGKKGKGLDTATKYEVVTDWPRLPKEIELGNPTGICTDTAQNIVVFHRGDRKWPLLGAMPKEPIRSKTILVINKDNGGLVKSWGDHLFVMPHGLKVDAQNNVWVTDVGLHQVFKFSYEGKLLLTLGEVGVAGNDQQHFNKPTDIAIAKDGCFYVSDGYGNSRVIKFSATGKYLFEWGTKGNGEGEFNIPHGIALDAQERVYVADRENHRIQVFDAGGKYIKQYADGSFGALCALALYGSKLFAVDDHAFLKLKHRGSDVLVFDTSGRVQTRFGRSGDYAGSACWYHALTVDENETIYVGDILKNKVQKFRKVVVR